MQESLCTTSACIFWLLALIILYSREFKKSLTKKICGKFNETHNVMPKKVADLYLYEICIRRLMQYRWQCG